MPRRSAVARSIAIRLALSPLLLGLVSAATAQAANVTAEKTDRGVTVKIDGELFAEYLAKSGNKPIVWPIIGPSGTAMTRAYPMQDVKGETRDHVHHRSLWFTHGDVNGADFWKEEGKCGTTVHREFIEVSEGARAIIVTRNDWLNPDGAKQCEDERRLIFSTNGDARIIDFEIQIRASEGALTFGDTKEGTFGVRVPEGMQVEAKKGGRIVNDKGQIDGAAWGQRAAWVDYHGPVDGEQLGIAILNHPSSFRFPTHWHVRTYGLFAANPFGLHDFTGSAKSPHRLEKGGSIALRYRVILHRGDEKEARIAAAFEAYAAEKAEN